MNRSIGPCRRCGGDGRIPQTIATDPDGAARIRWIDCPPCAGTGEIRIPVQASPDRGVILWLTAACLVVIGVLWLLSIAAAPRSRLDPTASQPGVPVVADIVGSGLARVPAGASGRAAIGAPSTIAVSPGSTLGATGPTSGGAPLIGASAGRPTRSVLASVPTKLGTVIEAGSINQAASSHGRRYLAIRAPRGTVVRICGPASCRIMRSTDYGPKHGTGKIADVAIAIWREICGLPDRRGTCPGTIEFPIDIALPPTDTK